LNRSLGGDSFTRKKKIGCPVSVFSTKNSRVLHNNGSHPTGGCMTIFWPDSWLSAILIVTDLLLQHEGSAISGLAQQGFAS